jgi:Tol biopolymer transport system component
VSDGSASDRARWQRVDQIFAAALEQPAERRSDFLAHACGADAELRREVESLLVHAREDGFLGVPATAEARRLLADTLPEPLAGQRLGRFEVLAKLGAGGMGEVYLAHDPKLERRVALKLLPGHLAADPDRIRRFRREALAVSALNHPNILTVHEVVEAEGREVLVSELVEGVTLRERLRNGPLPIATALDLAVQIARGLAAAHGVGIVHRDVKPENVMIRDDGLVKLLDFGIAKSPVSGAVDLTHSPTRVATATGMILGTASYMSPEQARGETAGRQADIWALGCVLYEALTGRQAFPGPTVSDVLAAILTREPDWDALPAEAPSLARAVLRRCLQKSPEQRLHDVADVRLELEEAMREPAVADRAAGGSAGQRLPRTLGWIATAAGVAAVVLGAWHLTRAQAPVRMLSGRFQLLPPAGVELVAGGNPTLAISPDGRSVAFTGSPPGAAPQLFLRTVSELGARPVLGTEGADTPFFSPDGRWLAFHSRGALRKAPIGGGQPLVICEAPVLRGASWGEGGTIVFSNGTAMLRVSAAGGQPQPLTADHRGARERRDRWPQHLPGGRDVLFLDYGGVGEANHRIAVLSLATRQERTLLRAGTYPRYAAGQLVFSRLGTLYAASFDPERLELAGEPRPVLDDIGYHSSSSVARFDLSPGGSLVFSPGSPRLRDAELVRVDRQGRISPLVERKAAYGTEIFSSPEGRHLGVFISSSIEESDLWTFELARRRWTRLTSHGKAWGRGLWSHDGRWIFFSMLVQGDPKIFRIAADGGGPVDQLTTGASWDFPAAMTPDGRLLLLERSPAGDIDLLTVDLDGDRVPRPYVATPMVESESTFSPDGRWVIFTANYEGSNQIYARPFPGPGTQVRVSTEGGRLSRWSARGEDEIFYRCPRPGAAGAEDLCAVTVQAGRQMSVNPPRRLFSLDPALGDAFNVSHDGAAFYMVRFAPEAATERRIVYAPSWIDELTTTPR